MSFEVDAEAYRRFMGRYSEPLAEQFAVLVLAGASRRALDVGCGPGALTARLVQHLGRARVAAVDPSSSFVTATRTRLPGVDVRLGTAEQLPFADDEFDVTAAQLVIHFLDDPERGIGEMARVTRPGGIVAACVWDFAGGRDPLSVFWRAVRDLDGDAGDEAGRPGAGRGQLLDLFRRSGLDRVEESTLCVTAAFSNADEWWYPFTLGVGPAGGYLGSLDPARRARLRARCTELLPVGSFTVAATAWTVVAVR